MRSIDTFSDEVHFPQGFQQSGFFSANEASLLERFGLTMQGLQHGTLMPITAEEHYFLAELDGEFNITSELAKCWRKYNKRITRYELSTPNPRSNKRTASATNDGYTDDDQSTLDDDSEDDVDNELDL